MSNGSPPSKNLMAGERADHRRCSSLRSVSTISPDCSVVAMVTFCQMTMLAVMISRWRSTIWPACLTRKSQSSTGSRSGRHGSPSPSATGSCSRSLPIPRDGKPMPLPGASDSPQQTAQASASLLSGLSTRTRQHAASAARHKPASEWQNCAKGWDRKAEKTMKNNHLRRKCHGYQRASAAEHGIDDARWHCLAQVRAHHKYSIAANAPVPN